MGKRRNLLLILLFLVAFTAMYLAPLGRRPMVTPDETRYAEIPREMLATGNFVSPHLVGLRYFEKPVMGYWISAAIIRIFGENAFAARLHSALAAGLCSLILALFVYNINRKRNDAYMAAAIFLTGFGTFATGVFNCLDATFSLFTTGAMLSFFMAYSTVGKRQTTYSVLAGISCGLAFLTKGFVVFAVMGVSILPFLIWERRLKELLRLAWLPALAVFLITLPWAIAVHLQEPDFWHYFVVVEHLHRFASEDAQHTEPLWYYVPILLGGMMPWLFVAPAATSGIVHTHKTSSITRFCLCWIIFPFIFFSLSDGKLGTYILPLLPPFVILITLGLQAYFTKKKQVVFKWGLLALATFVGFAALFFIVAPLELWTKGTTFSCNPLIVKYLLAGAALAWALITATAALKKSLTPVIRVIMTASGTALMLATLHLSLSTMNHRRKMPVDFLQSRLDEIRAAELVVSNSYLAPAVAWATGRTDIDILIRGGELQYGLSAPDAQNSLLNFETFGNLAAEHKGKTLLIISDKTLRKYSPHLQKPITSETVSGISIVRF